MTIRFAMRRNDTTHTLATNRYIWRHGAWVRTASSKTIVSDRTGSIVGGWRVPYPRRF